MYDQQAAQNTVGQSPVPRDEEFGKMLHAAASEAAERVTFHRMEVERWDRIGRAAQAALSHVQNANPVPQQAPDGFLEQQPMQSGF